MNYTEILTSIRKIVRTVNLESKRIEKEHGISIPQLLSLKYLHDQPHFQSSQKGIKDFLQLNASTVSGIINRLEKKGFVAKLPKQKDKRLSIITITAKGAELLEQTPEPLHEKLIDKLAKLSPAELTEVENAFQVILNFFNIEDEVELAPIITAQTNINEQLDHVG